MACDDAYGTFMTPFVHDIAYIKCMKINKYIL